MLRLDHKIAPRQAKGDLRLSTYAIAELANAILIRSCWAVLMGHGCGMTCSGSVKRRRGICLLYFASLVALLNSEPVSAHTEDMSISRSFAKYKEHDQEGRRHPAQTT